LSPKSLDVTFASNFFEHVDDDAFVKILNEIAPVTKPGGRLIIMQPNFRFAYKNYLEDYTHVRIYTDEGLVGRLESLGWKIEKVVPGYVPFSMASTGKISVPRWLIRLYLSLPWHPLGKQMLVIASLPR